MTLSLVLCSGMLLVSTTQIRATLDRQAPVVENPYHVIIERNPFGLRPQPQSTATRVSPLPAMDIYLTGIYALRGTEKVFLQIMSRDKGVKAELTPPLAEGDFHGQIKIVSIDIDQGTAVVNVGGQEQTLTLKKAAPKLAPATPPVVVPGSRVFSAQQAFSPPAASGLSPKKIPLRNMRTR